MGLFSIFKKKTVEIEEADSQILKEFWDFFRGQTPKLLSIIHSMETADDSEIDGIVSEFEFIFEKSQEQLWKMMPKVKEKLFFAPLPGELANGKVILHITATKDCKPIEELLIQLAPSDITDKWQIEY